MKMRDRQDELIEINRWEHETRVDPTEVWFAEAMVDHKFLLPDLPAVDSFKTNTNNLL